jgi:hypothetical protein
MDKLVQVSAKPTEGQFVAVWMYGGNPWSGTFKWIDGILMEYVEEPDGFVTHLGTGNDHYFDNYNPIFYIAQE